MTAWALPILIVATVVWVPGFVLSLVAAGISGMAFDTPGSAQQVRPWIIFFALLTSPFAILLALGGAWTLYLISQQPTAAVTCALLPLLNVAAFALAVLLPSRRR